MEGQTQEHPVKNRHFDIKDSHPTKLSVRNLASFQAEEKKQKGKEADASMDTQSRAMPDKDQTRVAERIGCMNNVNGMMRMIWRIGSKRSGTS